MSQYVRILQPLTVKWWLIIVNFKDVVVYWVVIIIKKFCCLIFQKQALNGTQKIIGKRAAGAKF